MMLVKNRARQRVGACGRARSPPLPLVFRAQPPAIAPAALTATGPSPFTAAAAAPLSAVGAGLSFPRPPPPPPSLLPPPAKPTRAALLASSRPSVAPQDPLTASLPAQLAGPHAAATTAAAAAASAAFASSAPHSPATAVSEGAGARMPRAPSELAAASGCSDAATAAAGPAAEAAPSGAPGASPLGARADAAPCFARGSVGSVGTAAAVQRPSNPTLACLSAPSPPSGVAVWSESGPHDRVTAAAGTATAAAAAAACGGVGAVGRAPGPLLVATTSAAGGGPSPFARCSAPPDLCRSGGGTAAASLAEQLLGGPEAADAGRWHQHRQPTPTPLGLVLQQQQQQQQQQWSYPHHPAILRLKPTLQRELSLQHASLQHVMPYGQQLPASLQCAGGWPCGNGGSSDGDVESPRMVGDGDGGDGGELGGGRGSAGVAGGVAGLVFGRMSAPPGNVAVGYPSVALRCGSGSSGHSIFGRRSAAAVAAAMAGGAFEARDDGGWGEVASPLQRSGSFGSFKRRRSFRAQAAAEGEGSPSVRHCSSTGLCEPALDAAVAAAGAVDPGHDPRHPENTRPPPPPPQSAPQVPSAPEQLRLLSQGRQQEQQQQYQEQPGAVTACESALADADCHMLDLRAAAGYSTTPPSSEAWSPDGAHSGLADSSPGDVGGGPADSGAVAGVVVVGGGGRGGGASSLGGIGRPPLRLAAACDSSLPRTAAPAANDDGDGDDAPPPLTPGEATSMFLGALVLDDQQVLAYQYGSTTEVAAAAEPLPLPQAEATATCGGSVSDAAAPAPSAQCNAGDDANDVNVCLANLAAEWRREGGPDGGDELLMGPDDGLAAALRGDPVLGPAAWAPPPLPAPQQLLQTSAPQASARTQAGHSPQSAAATLTAAAVSLEMPPVFARAGGRGGEGGDSCSGGGGGGGLPGWARSAQSEPAWWARKNGNCSDGCGGGGGGISDAVDMVAVLRMLESDAVAAADPPPPPAHIAGSTATALAAPVATLAAGAPPAGPTGSRGPRRDRQGRRGEAVATWPGGDGEAHGGRGCSSGGVRKAVGEETEEQLQLLLGDLIGRGSPAPDGDKISGATALPSPPPPAPNAQAFLQRGSTAPLVSPPPPPPPLSHGLFPAHIHAQLQQQQQPQSQSLQQQVQQQQHVYGPWFLGYPGFWDSGGGEGGAAGAPVKIEDGAAVAPGAPRVAGLGPQPPPRPMGQPGSEGGLGGGVPARRGGRRGQQRSTAPPEDGGSGDGDVGATCATVTAAAAAALPDREFLDRALQQQRQLWDELREMQQQQAALLQQQADQQRQLVRLLTSPRAAVAAAASVSSSPSRRRQQQEQQPGGSGSCSSSPPPQEPRVGVGARIGVPPPPAFGRWSMPARSAEHDSGGGAERV